MLIDTIAFHGDPLLEALLYHVQPIVELLKRFPETLIHLREHLVPLVESILLDSQYSLSSKGVDDIHLGGFIRSLDQQLEIMGLRANQLL